MSPSGAEFIRQVKSQIREIDPSAVHELIGDGVAIVDVRETDEFATGHLPGARPRPARLPRVAHRRASCPTARSASSSTAPPATAARSPRRR